MPSLSFARPVLARAALLFASLPAVAAPLVTSRFEAAPLASAESFKVATSGRAHARVALLSEGTIDTYRGPRTAALVLTADFRPASSARTAASVSTPSLPVANAEADLGRLTLGFDLWISRLRPVRVLVASLDAKDNVTGVVATTLVPPAAGAYYRFTPDLGTFTAVRGKFDPRAPKVRFAFELADDTASTPLPREEFTLKIDNLSYVAPSYYVSPKGSNSADGRTPATAFATLQRASDAAAPGDMVLVMEGTYVSPDREELVSIRKAGQPDRWIIVRAHPGHRPVLRGNGWNVVSMNERSAYLELRGLTVRGFVKDLSIADAQAQGKAEKPDGSANPPDCAYNTNGIALDSRPGTEKNGKAHHIRIIGNTVAEMPGGGLSAIAGDHVTIEGNHVYENAHTMRYAGSGISVFRAWDFDDDKGYKFYVVNNRAHGNRCHVVWTAFGKVSDGNGIIVDDFWNYQEGASKIPYEGRTLVQNNVAFGNGGSGIHAYAANHVDIFHNTAYHNAQSPELVWRQIYAGGKTKDVRIVGNILWAQKGRPTNFNLGWQSENVLYQDNVVYGDGDNEAVKSGGGLGDGRTEKQAKSVNNRVALPRLVNPSLDATVADFRLLPDSPARDAASPDSPARPWHDLDGTLRPQGPALDVGAYEYTSPAPGKPTAPEKKRAK